MMIFNSIDPSPSSITFHKEEETVGAKTMWDRLVDKFSKNTGAHKDAVLSRFSSFRFQSGRTVEENVDDLIRITQKLIDIGVTYPNEIRCAKLIVTTAYEEHGKETFEKKLLKTGTSAAQWFHRGQKDFSLP